MTSRMRQMHSDPGFRTGLESLGRIQVEAGARERVWRLAGALAGPERPVNLRHLEAANALAAEHRHVMRRAA